MPEIEEIERTLRDPASGLLERIVRDIGLYTVGLLRVSRTREGERLDLCGTGTLVSVAGDRYIKTAAHVWEKLLKSDAPTSVGVTLKEYVDHKSLIDRALALGALRTNVRCRHGISCEHCFLRHARCDQAACDEGAKRPPGPATRVFSHS
jgi:hypothetical protein